jgi:hypothetical protein
MTEKINNIEHSTSPIFAISLLNFFITIILLFLDTTIYDNYLRKPNFSLNKFGGIYNK